MDNKTLWSTVGVAIVLISLLSYGYNGFKKDIKLHEQRLDLRFDQEYSRIISTLKDQNAKAFERFADGFNKSVAIEQADTSYFMLSVAYEYPSLNYLNCLKSDVEATLASKRNEALNKAKKADFSERFGSSGLDFIEKLREEENLFTKNQTVCEKYFGKKEIEIHDPKHWADIEKVLTVNSRRNGEYAGKNSVVERKFRSDFVEAKSELKWDYRSKFDQIIESNLNSILQSKEVEFKTTTETIGTWITSVEEVSYNRDNFDAFFNEALKDQWKDNSLYTGAKPYTYCFRSDNSCSGYNCSEINVTAGNNDVLVTIKDDYGRVVRHAYINARNEYTFELPNGRYQTYFYAGKGWNPNKKIPSQSCRNLIGGFVEFESFSKDPEQIYLNNHILEYELYSQFNGNFETRNSSPTEAF